MGRSLFYELLESGQVKVTDEGLVTILGEYALFFPARVFLHWQEMLISKLGDEGKKMMYDMGRFQATQSLKRYTKTLDLKKLDKFKIFEFSVRIISMIGHGSFVIEKVNPSAGTASITNKKLPLAHAYSLTRGKSEYSIDFYVSGIFAGALGAIAEKEVGCLETKCLAKGDTFCHFELSPKIKPF